MVQCVHAVCISDLRGKLLMITQCCQQSDKSICIASAAAAVCLAAFVLSWVRTLFIFVLLYISLFTTACWLLFFWHKHLHDLLFCACVPVRTGQYQMLFCYLLHAAMESKWGAIVGGLKGNCLMLLEILIILSERFEILKWHFTHVVMISFNTKVDQVSDVNIMV